MMSLLHTKTNSVTRRADDAQLMPPPPKRIKRPKNVIDEESYTDAISEIIARDFFPGLLETETQQEYLDALESQDGAWISSAERRLQQVMTPGRGKRRRATSIQASQNALDIPRVATGDTMRSERSDISPISPSGPEINTNMSLDKFQSLYTSEDNESFYKLIDKQNRQRAEKYAWMWSANNKLPSKMMLRQKEVEMKVLQSRCSLEDDGGERNRLAIRDANEKPARPDAWRSRPNNQLMFAPEGVEDSVTTVAQMAQDVSRAAPKGITYGNTRIASQQAEIGEASTPSSPSISAVKNAIAGQRRASDTESGYEEYETPRVNGYSFVDDEEPKEETARPILSLDLGIGDLNKNPFIIHQQSNRENLHHRMVDRNARSKRLSQKNGLTGKISATPVPKFPSSPRVTSEQLTPAAQRLWSQVGGGFGQRSSGAFDRTPHSSKRQSSLRTRWTPK